MHLTKHTTLFEPQLSWPDMDLRMAYGNMFVTNAYVKPFRTAYETQGKSYDLMEIMPARY